jgi:PAS domain-containing protein
MQRAALTSNVAEDAASGARAVAGAAFAATVGELAFVAVDYSAGLMPTAVLRVVHIVMCLVVIVALRRRTASLSDSAIAAVFVVIVAPFFPVFWLKEQLVVTRFDATTTFIGHKLVMLGVALLAPPIVWLVVTINVLLSLEAVLEWSTLLNASSVRAPGEPWVTLVVALLCSVLIVRRMYHRRVEQRLVRTLIDNAGYERVVLAAAAIRDLSNTPLQIIKFSVALLSQSRGAWPVAIRSIKNAVQTLSDLSASLGLASAGAAPDSFDARRLLDTAISKRVEDMHQNGAHKSISDLWPSGVRAMRLMRLLEDMSDALVCVDRAWRFTFANRRAGVALGRPPTQLIGCELWKEFPEAVTHPFGQAFRQTMDTGVAQTLEAFYPPWSRWFETRSFAIEDGLAIFFVDITERKRAAREAALRQRVHDEAQTLAHFGFWEWELGSNEVTWSDELYRIFGLAPETFEPTFESFLAHTHPDDRERVRGLLDAVLKDHEARNFEERIVRPNGETRTLRSWGAVTLDARGNVRGMLGVCCDMTGAEDHAK